MRALEKLLAIEEGAHTETWAAHNALRAKHIDTLSSLNALKEAVPVFLKAVFIEGQHGEEKGKHYFIYHDYTAIEDVADGEYKALVPLIREVDE